MNRKNLPLTLVIIVLLISSYIPILPTATAQGEIDSETMSEQLTRTYTLNLFAQITQPAGVRSVRLVAAKDTRQIDVTLKHLVEGNDFELLLVDAVTKETYTKVSSPIKETIHIDVPHAGEFDIVCIYRTNDIPKSDLQRSPVQMIVSGQELEIPDHEFPGSQLIRSLGPTETGSDEILLQFYIDRNVKIGVLLDGEIYKHVRGHEGPSGTFNLFLNHERMTEGPHNVMFFTSKPNSANQSIVTHEIFIDQKNTFRDVPLSHWAKKDIERMSDLGIIQGRSEGTFQPDQPITRQEFLKMLVLSAKNQVIKKPLSFIDITDDSWSKKFIDLGSAAGWINGEIYQGNRMFFPNRTINRLEAVAMMARTPRINDLPAPEFIPGIEDRKDIQTWGVQHVEKLLYYDWIKGYRDATFRPEKLLTRAEAVTMLASFTRNTEFQPNWDPYRVYY